MTNITSTQPQQAIAPAQEATGRPATKPVARANSATAAVQPAPAVLADFSWWITGTATVIAVILSATLAALIRAATGDLTIAWFISRGAGIASYLLITGSMIYGLMITTRTASGAVPAPVTFSMHEFISWLGLALALTHAVVLMWDRYIKYSPANILIPFNSSYRPVWIGIGQVAFYISALVIASFYAKKRIGHKAWRMIHYISFVTFLLVTLHGIQAGTDSNTTAMQIVYITSLATVLFLTVIRILTAKLAKAPRLSQERAVRKV